MRIDKAVKILKERYLLGQKEYYKYIPDYIEALGMSINALEREMPKPAKDFGYLYCQSCDYKMEHSGYTYCPNCGQRLGAEDEIL